ncbi:MAG: GntR family transcriptional regulator [Haliea sp.]|nr:MAG: GntR family transcriptional regulator [Haliea sp.]
MQAALIDGYFTPRQTFTIRGLAQVFGTSPMPVRDALKRLVAEHALQLLPNRSVIVPLMSRERFQEILQIRLSLEPMIAARATVQATPRLIDAMSHDHDRMCAAVTTGDAHTYLSSNRSFHFRLYEAAETLLMFSLTRSLWMQIGPYLNQVFRARDGDGARQAGHHHTAILQALRRGDAPAVSQGIWHDLSDAADAILAANEFADAVPASVP